MGKIEEAGVWRGALLLLGVRRLEHHEHGVWLDLP
jgi:hypothetical protein